MKKPTTQCTLDEYCGERCKAFAARMHWRHEDRLRTPSTVRFGTCGGLAVFEEKQADDAGILEWFDDAGAMVAAIDDVRDGGCDKYGRVPTCTTTWRDLPRATVTAHLTSNGASVNTLLFANDLDGVIVELESCYRDALWVDATVHGTVEVIGDGVPDTGTTHWKTAKPKVGGAWGDLVACSVVAFGKINASTSKATGVHVVAEFTSKPPNVSGR